MKELLPIFLTSGFLIFQLGAVIQEIKSFDEVKEEIARADDTTLWAFDLDEVCIVAKDKALQGQKHRKILVKGIEKEYSQNSDQLYECIFPQYHSKLVDPAVVELLQNLKEKKIKHIALTARGAASSFTSNLLEVWQTQLTKLELQFHAFPLFSKFILKNDRFEGKKVIYDRDVLYTNGIPKDVALEVFWGYVSSIFNLKKLYFIEDSLENLQLLEAWCKNYNIEFVGYHFTAVDDWHKNNPLDEVHVRVQIRHLIEKKVWLSDEQVCEYLKKRNKESDE